MSLSGCVWLLQHLMSLWSGSGPKQVMQLAAHQSMPICTLYIVANVAVIMPLCDSKIHEVQDIMLALSGFQTTAHQGVVSCMMAFSLDHCARERDLLHATLAPVARPPSDAAQSSHGLLAKPSALARNHLVWLLSTMESQASFIGISMVLGLSGSTLIHTFLSP